MTPPNHETYRARLWSMFPDAHSIRFIPDPELDEETEGWCKRVHIEVGPAANPNTRTFFLAMATDQLLEYRGEDEGDTLDIPEI